MKKVKELKKWIELYGEVHAAAEELELAYEYVKEEIITEEEVDAAYKKALHLLEDLEFRNMLRDEADQMSCVLKINSGAGGTESQDWASMLMRMYQRWAENNGYKISIANYQEGDEAGIEDGYDRYRGRLRLWLSKEREWRASFGTCISLQRPR